MLKHCMEYENKKNLHTQREPDIDSPYNNDLSALKANTQVNTACGTFEKIYWIWKESYQCDQALLQFIITSIHTHTHTHIRSIHRV